MQLFCNALIIELPNGEIRLSALVVSESTLTKEQKTILDKVGVSVARLHNDQYDLKTPADKVHVIVMKN